VPLFTLGLLLLLAPGVAWARGGGRDQAAENLLAQGAPLLQAAERSWRSGNLAVARTQAEEAERRFRDALQLSPGLSRAALLAGQAAVFAQAPDRAEKWLAHLSASSPRGPLDADALYLDAFIQLIAQRNAARAVARLEQMLALYPTLRAPERDTLYYAALDAHGRALLQRKDHGAAVRTFQTAARVARGMGQTRKENASLGNSGIAMRMGQRYEEAAEVFTALRAAEPRSPIWPWQLGLLHAQQGEWIPAITEYRKAIALRGSGAGTTEMDEEIKTAWLRLGNCLRQVSMQPEHAGRREELLQQALEAIRTFTREVPRSPLGPKWMGVLLIDDLGRPYEAEPWFRQAFEMDKDCDDSLRYLIQIHSHHPPPPLADSATEEEKERALAAWHEPLAAWQKDLLEHEEARRDARAARVDRDGEDGCL
jgi:tetratricopeptide (TPR) repeat protein